MPYPSRRHLLRLGVAAAALGCAGETGRQDFGAVPPGSEYDGPAFTFTRIQDDVYHARGTGALSVGANAAVVINESDVLLVDSHISPAAARALVDELREITDKPVRYVVNTHFHFDHAHGNQIYPDGVEIIGHEFTREVLATGQSRAGRAYDAFIGAIPDRVAALETEVAAATDPERRAELESQLAYQRNYLAGVEAVVPTPPTATLARRMVLFRGSREIRLLFYGRGHTGGDVVVHLPAEGLLATGDLITGGLPYMGDGYLLEWAETLEHVKGLAFDRVLPGHGEAFAGKEKFDHLQAYLRDLWDRAKAMRDAGVEAGDAAGRIDMRDHAEHYPDITEPGVSPVAVLRVYELLDDTTTTRGER